MRRTAAVLVTVGTMVIGSGRVDLACAEPQAAPRATFNISPTQLVLPRAGASASLVLRNDSPETLRFQVTSFKWSNSPDGEMQLAPTKDIVFFPAIFTVEPGETRRLRVGCTVRAEKEELAYRLLIEQLASRAESPVSGGVQMLTQLNVPVFVQPASSVARATIDSLTIAGGAATFDLRNAGTVHVRVGDVLLQGHTATGVMRYEQNLRGWYLLPGESRRYRVPIAAATCQTLASMQVTVTFPQAPGQKLEAREPIGAAACGTP